MIGPGRATLPEQIRQRALDINELVQVIAECGPDHPHRALYRQQLAAARAHRTALIDSLGQQIATPTNIRFPIRRAA